MLHEARDGRRWQMTAQQQQLMDSFYALDNVVTIKITMAPAEWDKVRNEEPKGGRCFWEWTGGADTRGERPTRSRFPEPSSPRATTFTNVGIKKKSFCGSIDSNKPCIHVDFGKVQQRRRGAGRSPDRDTLRDAQQLHPGQVLRQADAGLPDDGYGGPAQFAVQLRPCVRERNVDRPRRRRRQRPRHLRQCRADHEALHRTQFQRQYERQSVRDRAQRTIFSKSGWNSSGSKASRSSRTKPT